MEDKIRIKIIGNGGIGGCLIPTLCRVLNYGSAEYSFDDVDIHLVDGDEYEERNRDRQAFQERGNKAEVTAKQLEEEYPNLFFRAHPLYVDEDNLSMVLEENDVVFLCVDNHATRLMVSNHCETMNNITLISGGNGYTDGSVQVFIRKDGENKTLPLDSDFHPEIANPNDKHPNEVEHREGCLEMAHADPQLLIANNCAATLMLNAFHNLLTGAFDGPFRYDEVFFDLANNGVIAKNRTGGGGIEALVQAKLAQNKV